MPAMYRAKDRSENFLFDELMPFGGRLMEENRWLKIKSLIPWGELEREYASYFSGRGRPALDGRLVIGLFLLKHMTVLSDENVVLELQENVYWQAFCGMDQFETAKKLNKTSLTKIRHKLGVEFVRELEKKTYQALVEKKIIRGKGMLVDATVMPEKIRFPNDIGLLNDVREWTLGWLKDAAKTTGEKIRTYCRNARKLFLNFAKKKLKTKQMIRWTKKQMLQFVRRNLDQLKIRLLDFDYFVRAEIESRLVVAETVYAQQREMYDGNIKRCTDRIVSWWREYVRPIKRGKSGAKDTEFGPKASLSHVDGFTFLDEFNHDNYSEARVDIVEKQIRNYQELFGQKPPSITGDQLYGNRENRELLKTEDIRAAFKPLGRKSEDDESQKQYYRRKQRERNRIEGDIGNLKEHYGCDAIRYHYVEGSEMWVRLGLLAKNLKMAMARVA
jgi:transposase, IS5 family